MNEAPTIADYNKYNERMEAAMLDKLFFADKIQPDLIVDFGCADGVLLRAIHKLKPDIKLIGYDNDPTMTQMTKDFPIFSMWNYVVTALAEAKNPAIVLSSVIHEVFHYGSKHDIDVFWRQVFDSGFKYIVIRDMVPARSIDRVSCINDIRKVYRKFLDTKALNDFEKIWGSIENNKQLVHFLLKYRYLEPNWDREVRENYMPITRESLLAKTPLEYNIIFHEHYVLPYLLQNVQDDFGIELKDPTHLKLILKKV